jgi:phage regulator Rha-like protein
MSINVVAPNLTNYVYLPLEKETFMANIVPQITIETRIHFLRNKKVMLDSDLSGLYDIETGQLKRAVRRNIERFPDDFMFELTREEYESLRCQFGILNRGAHAKFLPFAFTESGVAMLSSVLNSKRAIEINIQIMRAFIRLREVIIEHKDLRQAIEKLERRVDDNDKAIQIAFNTLKQLLEPPVTKKPKIKIGFAPPEK